MNDQLKDSFALGLICGVSAMAVVAYWRSDPIATALAAGCAVGTFVMWWMDSFDPFRGERDE